MQPREWARRPLSRLPQDQEPPDWFEYFSPGLLKERWEWVTQSWELEQALLVPEVESERFREYEEAGRAFVLGLPASYRFRFDEFGC